MSKIITIATLSFLLLLKNYLRTDSITPNLKGSTHQPSAPAVKNVQWATSTCKFGWAVNGIFRPDQNGGSIQSVAISNARDLIVTGEATKTVNLWRYPCNVEVRLFCLVICFHHFWSHTHTHTLSLRLVASFCTARRRTSLPRSPATRRLSRRCASCPTTSVFSPPAATTSASFSGAFSVDEPAWGFSFPFFRNSFFFSPFHHTNTSAITWPY